MAELAASIFGIVSAGVKITIVLFQIGEEMGAAGKEARLIASEISVFCAVLKALHAAIEKVEKSPYFDCCRDTIADMTAASLSMYDEVLDATEELRNMAAKGAKGVRQRIGWVVFQRSKIKLLRAALESYKSTLSLMLETITITEKASRQLGTSITQDLVEEAEQDSATLESLKLAQRVSLLELDEAQQLVGHDDELPVAEDQSRVFLHQSSLPESSSYEADEYMTSIRTEIDSFRLEHNCIVAQDADLSKAAIHSRRFTQLFDDDHRRLSQRWSMGVPAPLYRHDRPLSTAFLSPIRELKTMSEKPQALLNTAPGLSTDFAATREEEDTLEVATKFHLFLAQLCPEQLQAAFRFLRNKDWATIEDLELPMHGLEEEEFPYELSELIRWLDLLSSSEQEVALCAFAMLTQEVLQSTNLNIPDCVRFVQNIMGAKSDAEFGDDLADSVAALVFYRFGLNRFEQAVWSYSLLRFRHGQLPIRNIGLTQVRSLPPFPQHKVHSAVQQAISGSKNTSFPSLTPGGHLYELGYERSIRPGMMPLKNPADLALLEDIPAWLQNIRLHKYTSSLNDLKWQDLIDLDDIALERRGVKAIGARRKLAKIFQQVKETMNEENNLV